MKKIIFWAMSFIISTTAFCQPINQETPSVKTDFLKKSRKQNTAAWILLGGGTTLTMVGVIVGFSEVFIDLDNIFADEPQKTSNTGEVLFYTGLASMVGSIPFFIAASRNKKNANTFSAIFKIEQQPSVSQGTFIRTPYPAVAVKISL